MDLFMTLGKLISMVIGLILPILSFSEDIRTQTVESQNISYTQNAEGLYVAKIELNTAEELKDLFDRAEVFLDSNQSYLASSPIEVVLHGPEVRVFQRKNYQQYKMLVDQAARLDAYNIIDIRVCELWMGFDGVNHSELPPFVDTVPNGPEYHQQLLNNGYKHF